MLSLGLGRPGKDPVEAFLKVDAALEALCRPPGQAQDIRQEQDGGALL